MARYLRDSIVNIFHDPRGARPTVHSNVDDTLKCKKTMIKDRQLREQDSSVDENNRWAFVGETTPTSDDHMESDEEVTMETEESEESKEEITDTTESEELDNNNNMEFDDDDDDDSPDISGATTSLPSTNCRTKAHMRKFPFHSISSKRTSSKRTINNRKNNNSLKTNKNQKDQCGVSSTDRKKGAGIFCGGFQCDRKYLLELFETS